MEERESEARSGAMGAESSGDYSYVPNNIIVGLRTTRPAVLMIIIIIINDNNYVNKNRCYSLDFHSIQCFGNVDTQLLIW